MTNHSWVSLSLLPPPMLLQPTAVLGFVLQRHPLSICLLGARVNTVACAWWFRADRSRAPTIQSKATKLLDLTFLLPVDEPLRPRARTFFGRK